ncbi:MAG: hypothetical protein Kow00103_05780 [Candidatus Caldatribacteriota bacterium]
MLESKRIKEEIKKRLKQGPLLLDGAMGTMLQSYGLSSGFCPEEWNLSNPEIIKDIHQQYLRAGAEIILTNTFGANRIKLNNFQLGDSVKKINIAGVKLAKEAIQQVLASEKNKIIFVAASLGPTGKLLEPYGELKKEEAYDNYKEQISILDQVKVDLLILETFFDLEEIKLALQAAKENSNLMVIASMTFTQNIKTIYGISPERAVKELEAEGADGVGANCGAGPEVLYSVLEEMKKYSNSYLLVEPNAGMPELMEGKVSYPTDPDTMAFFAQKFSQLGVNFIGGCCGTTPLHIKAISDKIKN